ncbi:MAG: trypsin-like peptidase domain-containing protein [Candidatus Rokubacteria bacterium]|nr:trypsin-like peptidase domain-containing protein [Candidatus Rokubacteria bacterium]
MRTVVAGLLLLGIVTSVAVTAPGTPEARSHTARADVPAMVTRVLPAVVSVTIRYVEVDEADQPVQRRGIGSGFIVDRRGYILTNNHVIDGAEEIRVRLTDERSFPGAVVGVDRATDLAVLKIEADNLLPLPLGDSSRLAIAEPVVAIGSPLWIEAPTVTVGIVSGLGRTLEEPGLPSLHNLIQTDAAINPGNSGGPLLNLAGQVVGINTAIAPTAHGIGFAIGIDTARPIIRALIASGRVVRSDLGVTAVSVTPLVASMEELPVERGVLVRAVKGNAGHDIVLRGGDLITAVDGRGVRDVHELHEALSGRRAGDTVRVTLWRERRLVTLLVPLRSEP